MRLMNLVAAAALVVCSAAATLAMYTVDSGHSSVVFRIGHMGVANMYGAFHAPTGTYHFDLADPAKSAVEITIETAKIDTGSEGRDKHLRNADFFDVEKHPTITFKGTKFEKTGEKTMKVVGDLTMLGVTKPVTAMIEIIGEGETRQGYKSGFEANFTIKRSEFGMTKYLEGNAIGDEVKLMVAIEGKRETAAGKE